MDFTEDETENEFGEENSDEWGHDFIFSDWTF